jgi:hypothetical protein
MSEWSDSAKAALAEAAKSRTIGGIPVATALTILGLIATLTLAGVSWGSGLESRAATLEESRRNDRAERAADRALLDRLYQQQHEQQTSTQKELVRMATILDERLPPKANR